MKLADANSIGVVDAVKQKMEELNPQLPPGAHLSLVVDQSTYTSKSFATVRNALIEAVLATGLILLLFLHTWRSTLIVLVSIPVSLLSTRADGGSALQPEPADDGCSRGERWHPGRLLDRRTREHRPPSGARQVSTSGCPGWTQ